MVLCDNELRAAIQNKHLIVDPIPADEHISTTALDLTLGSEFRVWRVPPGGATLTIDPAASDYDFTAIADQFLEQAHADDEKAVVMLPGQFMLALTAERVELPRQSRLAARVEGRSSLARLGVGVHVTAPTIHAGFRGFITLELTNQSRLPIRLKPGLRICQLVVEHVFGTPSADMSGIFQDQVSVTGGGAH
jgi:dCTP deaminase